MPDLQEEILEESPTPDIRFGPLPKTPLGPDPPKGEPVRESNGRAKEKRPPRDLESIYLKPQLPDEIYEFTERRYSERRSVLHRKLKHRYEKQLQKSLLESGTPFRATELILYGFNLALDWMGNMIPTPVVKTKIVFRRLANGEIQEDKPVRTLESRSRYGK
jgi:hypothetical protein